MSVTAINGAHEPGALPGPNYVHEKPSVPPVEVFGQREHDVLMKYVEDITQGYIETFKAEHNEIQSLEKLVVKTAGEVRHHITQLFLLGNAAKASVHRSSEARAQIADELLKMGKEHE